MGDKAIQATQKTEWPELNRECFFSQTCPRDGQKLICTSNFALDSVFILAASRLLATHIMKKLLFSFDIGHASIGWAVLDTSKENSPNLQGCGSVLFPTDDCLASTRRQLRRQRRHADRAGAEPHAGDRRQQAAG